MAYKKARLLKLGDEILMQLSPCGMTLRYDIYTNQFGNLRWRDKGPEGEWVVGKIVYADSRQVDIHFKIKSGKMKAFGMPLFGHPGWNDKLERLMGWPRLHEPAVPAMPTKPPCECGTDSCGGGVHSNYCAKGKWIKAQGDCYGHTRY